MLPLRISSLSERAKVQIVRSGKKGFSEAGPPSSTGYDPAGAAAELAHKRSQFVLKECGSVWPSVELMKKSAHSDWTVISVRNKIAELRREHRQQLAKVIKYQEHEHAQEAEDEYYALNPTGSWSAELKEHAKCFLRMANRIQTHQSDDFISKLRYTHIMALKPLYEKLQQLLIIEERAKLQRARMFPKSSQGWREMDTPDAKLKVARFLLLDKPRQDEILLREADWRAERADVDKVVFEFKTNVMFSEEVKVFVRENQTTDPRRRG